MNARIAASVISVVAGAAVWAQEPRVTLSPAALEEIADVEAEIDRIEAQTLERLAAPPDNEVQQIELLGKAMLYDKNLSVNLNEACAFCHMPETGFTGPVSELNRTTGSYPGSVRTRFSNRKPQSHAYAPLSPVVCTENSDSCVLVVQSADERMRHDAPDRLNGTRDRRILV